jgi:hypothetical protein
MLPGEIMQGKGQGVIEWIGNVGDKDKVSGQQGTKQQSDF